MNDIVTFGTKAETLQHLCGKLQLAEIPPLTYFTVGAWQQDEQQLLSSIRSRFQGKRLAIRSSALIEDSKCNSMAGAFLSLLHVEVQDRDGLREAVLRVIDSMQGHEADQVLVQEMAEDVALSGVIMTYDVQHGTPYYQIEYDDETGRTDVITSGDGVHKGLHVYREAPETMIESERVRRFLAMAKELEALTRCKALDIEFGFTKDGRLLLFQLRRMTLTANWHPVLERRVARQLAHIEKYVQNRAVPRNGTPGDRTILAVMPDWNPAEIISTTPRPLAASLYRLLITKCVWAQARRRMGYRNLEDAELMVMINHHPYIDVRNSFASFLPAALDETIGTSLVTAWLDRLEAFPENHDKIEFTIAQTCVDFTFDRDFSERYGNLLDKGRLTEYRRALLRLTEKCVTDVGEGSLSAAARQSDELASIVQSVSEAERHDSHSELSKAQHLLEHCILKGTLPFAIAARHAFIAEALLRSAVERSALNQTRFEQFKQSVQTITSEMLSAYQQVLEGTRSETNFLGEYGHLRPGTYEITSLRYDERDDLFLHAMKPRDTNTEFQPTNEECRNLNQLLLEAGFQNIEATDLLSYAKSSIAGREQLKHNFTRSLSDAMLHMQRWGEAHGLSRDDLSYLDCRTLLDCLQSPVLDDLDRLFLDLSNRNRQSVEAAHAFKLSHIIFRPRDVFVATINRSIPNFVGKRKVTAATIKLDANTRSTAPVDGRIVCIANADPGFDWIFTRSPAGLVTQYGGSNSHMAVRCAEFDLPAAIGCGEQIFERISQASQVELDGAEQIVRPVHAR